MQEVVKSSPTKFKVIVWNPNGSVVHHSVTGKWSSDVIETAREIYKDIINEIKWRIGNLDFDWMIVIYDKEWNKIETLRKNKTL